MEPVKVNGCILPQVTYNIQRAPAHSIFHTDSIFCTVAYLHDIHESFPLASISGRVYSIACALII